MLFFTLILSWFVNLFTVSNRYELRLENSFSVCYNSGVNNQSIRNGF